ncbi:PAS domain S-box-containing protein [Mariprofundus aestuarium]|uniref:PAS domain S-box-containing protein n=1 Tax=Mariprofundus aestuarium TaxID=1921086 RepID=A0A2K8L354_MARES|nr:PAS domain S-box protein [Mariprofundus aestuarium]ATX78676.1 PAS domain S-box-containing protein [Mariprofundus aestuarium]
MSEQEKQLSAQEVEQLQARAKKLAMEKSYFQLVMQMITRISETPGLENVIDSMLLNTMNVLGGSNLQLYYKIDEQLYYADVMGKKKQLVGYPDEVIARVYKTGREEEIEGGFEDTQLKTAEFTKAYTWVYPLKISSEVIAVFRMKNLHIDMRQLYEQLPAFFNFAALVLKNEILGQSRLQKINLQLEAEVATRKQTEKELRIAKDHLEAAVEERTAELREKSEELDLFFTSTLDLLCIADTDGYFRKLNPEWEKALGYPLDELIGRRFLDLIHPDDLESTLQAIAALSDQNPLLNFTNRYLHKDGTYRWLEWRSYPVASTIYASARDITERMKMEAELAERSAELKEINMQLSHELEERKAFIEKLAQSEKEYYALVHQLQVAVVVHDPDSSIHIYNDLACELLGLTPEQLEGKTAYDPEWHFFDEQGTPLKPDQYPVNRALVSKEAVRDLVVGVQRPASNDQIWVLSHANPIMSSGGEIVQVVVTFIDITDKVKSEEEIRRFNTELEQLVEERTEKLTETNKRLEGFNEIMAEREMRVVEIKQEVNLLSQQLGREMPYKEIWNALQEK